MIWRRLLVRSGTTLYQLHQAIEVIMNWDNFYLYQFKLFARPFSRRAASCENDRNVRLEDFRLHLGERFDYEYNFYCFWQVDIRLEAVLPFEQDHYPRCLAGKGDPPPEDIGGPTAYMQWLDDRFGFETQDAIYTLYETVAPILETLFNDNQQAFTQACEAFRADPEAYELAMEQINRSAWLREDDYKRRTINQNLKQILKSTTI